MHASKTITISIKAPFAQVNDFLGAPQNFARWAEGLGSALKNVDGRWLAETPNGRIEVCFTPKNPFGVADHVVKFDNGLEVYVPMRAIANADGTDIIFTLFQLPGMSREQFEGDIRLVEQDLGTLKNLLEQDLRKAG
jgi:hypothetical protein